MEHLQQNSIDSDQFVSLNEPHMQQHHETLQQLQQHQQHMQHQHHQLQMYQQQQQQQQQHDTHQLQLHHQQQQQSSHHQQQQSQQQQAQSQAPHLTNASTLNQQQQHRINRPMNPRSSLGRNINNLPFRPHQNPHAIHAAAAITPNAQNYLRQVPNPAPTDFPLRMLVQSDMVGAIIGRAGGTIRQITQQSKARIDVHREENSDQQEKIITIGGSPEACSTACQKILEVMLQEVMSGNTNHGTDIPLKILAYNHLIGRLIGKSGASIKKIMEQTNTKINVSASHFSDWSNERVITIEGSLEDINLAEHVISAKLRAAHVSDLSLTMQALNQQQHFMFPGLNPMSLMTGPYSQHPMLSTIVNSQPGHSGHNATRVPHQGPTLSGGHIYSGPPGYLPPIYPNIGAPSAHGGPNGPLLGFSSGMAGIENEKETVYLYIPNSTVGAIIGKFGSTIKEMINNSGALIKVAAAETSATSPVKSAGSNLPTENENQDQPGQNTPQPRIGYNANSNQNSINNNISERNNLTRRVSVVGTPEAQWTAQYLIYRKVSMESSTTDLSLMVEIHVPSNMVGKIIGKAGATVKHIQKQTRTTIRLPEERNTGTGEDSETPVYITGEFHNSQIAQRQIRNLSKENLYQYRPKQHQLSRQQHDGKEGSQNIDDNPRPNHGQADQDPPLNSCNTNDQGESADGTEDQEKDSSNAETTCTLGQTNSDDDTNRNTDIKSESDQRLGVTNSTPPRASSPTPQINNSVNAQHINKDPEHRKALETEIKNGLTPPKVAQDNPGDDIKAAPVNNCKS